MGLKTTSQKIRGDFSKQHSTKKLSESAPGPVRYVRGCTAAPAVFLTYISLVSHEKRGKNWCKHHSITIPLTGIGGMEQGLPSALSGQALCIYTHYLLAYKLIPYTQYDTLQDGMVLSNSRKKWFVLIRKRGAQIIGKVDKCVSREFYHNRGMHKG